jgi:hypothetical protein
MGHYEIKTVTKKTVKINWMEFMENWIKRTTFFATLYNTNIDFMHSALEGVVKRFFRYWFDEFEQSIKTFTK